MDQIYLKPDANAGTRVVFRVHGIVDEMASRAAKRAIHKDIEVCDISFAGNKQTIGTFPAHEVADWVDDPEYGERHQRTYAEKYAKEYAAFKAGNPQSQAGTPLEALAMSENKRRELRQINVWTVEALASLDGNNLKNLGMGGRELKNQAIAFLEQAAAGAGDQLLITELAKRDAVIAEMQAKLEALTSSDKTGAEPETTEIEPDVTASTENPQWATFSDEDIANMLTEAGIKVDGRWGRATLIEKAEEKIAAKTKQDA